MNHYILNLKTLLKRIKGDKMETALEKERYTNKMQQVVHIDNKKVQVA